MNDKPYKPYITIRKDIDVCPPDKDGELRLEDSTGMLITYLTKDEILRMLALFD